ncbi:E3 ubiquitin-protein ligase TRIM21-like isoform X2 [Gadus macrocephalus]|uniref:E3 ubiquitin-protein ligase TRIM21-like isoform X2 n=1 Tax=Gadus macrocephalus TaxID=80720 RepID=UPI0028CB948A|nr:E3 ubiquitin-protein ligase TRIM21-like isoform X2 [Gadus macrocephalus]
MSLDREETRKSRFAGRAKKKAKFRRRGSRQRVTMVTISDREETRKRRFALWFHITVIVSIGLLSILLISLRFNSPSPWIEGREHLLDELGSVMPTEEEEAPSITEFHSSTHVLPVGQTARYTCHAGGTPEPTVEWLHNGRSLERDGTDDQSEAWVERGFLFVRGGRYGVNTVCCMASNSAGTANHSAKLLVFDACDLTLDPNTANRGLSLSEDNRMVTLVGGDQSYPDHPERFDPWPQVLGREALTGRCYWEVEWEGGVYIGVAYRGITRRGRGDDSRLGRNNKSWSLYCIDDGRYSALYNGIQTALPLRPAGSTRVGVYLDRPAGSLSFYRVSPGGGGSSDTLTHLHTFWSSFTQEPSGVLSLSVSDVEEK